MDNLPPSLLLEILSRLPDSSDLARCRLTCKTLNSLSYDLTSLKLVCSFDRYIKSRSSPSIITPFKSIINNLVFKLSFLDSISIGVDEVLQGVSWDDLEDDSDDLHLTDVNFVSGWLPAVGEGLQSLCFCDFWVQSCWKRSLVLSLISRSCKSIMVSLSYDRSKAN